MEDLPYQGYAWTCKAVDERHILITGRADGTIHKQIWIYDVEDLSITEVGELVIQSATAPLIRVSHDTWWLVGGEPDSNKNRTDKVSIIKIIKQ
jgi:hypothetical protein